MTMAIKTASPIVRVSTNMSADPCIEEWKFARIKELDPRLVHLALCQNLTDEIQNMKQTDYTFVPSPEENSALIYNVIIEDENFPILLYVEFERMFEDRPMFNGKFFFLAQDNPLIGNDLKPGKGGHIFMTMPSMSVAGKEFADLSVAAFATIEQDGRHVVFDIA